MPEGLFLLAALAGTAAPTQVLAAGFSPYPQFDFNASAAQISTGCAAAREQAVYRLVQVAGLPDFARSFVNTPEALENILDDLNDETAAETFLQKVAVSSSVRQASFDCLELMEDFGAYTDAEAGSGVFSREDLSSAVSAYAAAGQSLDPVRQRLLDGELSDFKRGGQGLSTIKHAVLSALRARLISLQDQYDQNLVADKDYFLASSEDLSGLPEDYRAKLPSLNGGYVVGLDDADYLPFMENSTSAQARRKLEFLHDNRTAAQNVGLLASAFKARDEEADMLGYPDYASYHLENSMARGPVAVDRFLKAKQKDLIRQARRELAAIKVLKTEQEGPGDRIVHAWDWRYYDNELAKIKYQADLESSRRFFPLAHVLKELFAINETLLGVKFHRISDAAAWAQDVDLYEIKDGQGQGPVIGYFYLDLFPHPGKQAGTQVVSLIAGRELTDGSYQKPVSVLLGNFPRSEPGHPALLSFGEYGQVQALFGAFGELMSQTLNRAPYERFTGQSSPRDFTPVPGQLMAELAWQPEVVALISDDSQNPGHPLPPKKLKDFMAARQNNGALEALKQVFLARLDMRYHEYPPKDPTAVYKAMMKKIRLVAMTPGTNPEAGFSGLMDNGADYYAPLWSEVYAQNLLSRFIDEGTLNPAMGWLYRKEILEPGSSRDPSESIKAFLGGASNDEAAQ